MNELPFPEFEKEIHASLSAPNADPVFVRDLRVTLLERSKMKKQPRSVLRLAWGLAIATLLAVLLLASPRVAEALKQFLGYVPGIGYVQQGNSLRILSAPVTGNKDAVKVTIEKGTADSQRTVLLEYVEGVTPDPLGKQYCDTPARLILPDGTILKELSYETTMEGGKASPTGTYFGHYVFETMPLGQMEATLEIPCALFNASTADFKLKLLFQAADASQVMPVIELPTRVPTSPAPPAVLTTVPAPSAESTVDGFSIVLESETPLADGYILAGSYRWSDTRTDRSAVALSNSNIIDAKGQDVPYQEVETDPGIVAGPQQIPFAYQITGKDFAWPLRITVNAISVVQPGKATFQFDAGSNPQAGQTWNVNIDVPVAGHIIHVETIQLTAGRTPTQLGFNFIMTSDPFVASATVDDMNPIVECKNGCGGGGGGGADFGVSGFDSATGPFSYGSAAEGYSPAGKKTFVISNVSVFFKGPWQITWQPPTK
jgi:hypothetical protein